MRKMTYEMMEKAKKTFEVGVQSCEDIAKSLGISEKTLRNYFHDQCVEESSRILERTRKEKA